MANITIKIQYKYKTLAKTDSKTTVAKLVEKSCLLGSFESERIITNETCWSCKQQFCQEKILIASCHKWNDILRWRVKIKRHIISVSLRAQPTARDETRERSPTGRTNPWSPVSSSGGNPDSSERRRRRPTVQTGSDSSGGAQ